MSSLYKKRIESTSVQYGQSFVISGDTEEETVNNLFLQKKSIQNEILKAQNELNELKNSLKDLFEQKDTIIDQAKKSAEDIKTKAVLNAEEIVSKANLEKDAIVQEAKLQGQKQGFEAGYNDAKLQFQTDAAGQIKALEVLTNAAFEVKNEIIFSAETEIKELAILIAQKIIGQKFEQDSSVFKSLVQTAISLLKEKENIKIIVNPKLYNNAKEISSEIAGVLDKIEQIKIVQDKSISSDGAVVESVSSRIDARISTQLEELSRVLLANSAGENIIDEDIEEKISTKVNNKSKIKSKIDEAND